VVKHLPFLAILAGCDEAPCAGGSMLESPRGLLVTEDEHPTGWREAQCAECHAFDALHLHACTPEVDLVEAQVKVEQDGDASCAPCHGTNGFPVSP
jgi:hypothetical protein